MLYLRFSSLSGGVLLLLWCLIVLKSAGVSWGEALRACICRSGLPLLLLLAERPLLLSALRKRLRACDVVSSTTPPLWCIMAMRFSRLLLMCCGSCCGGGGGGGEPPTWRLLNNVAAPSSCSDEPWCGCELSGVRMPAFAKFCICAKC